MSHQVSLDEKAIHQATAFLADDPDGLRVVLAAIDALSKYAWIRLMLGPRCHDGHVNETPGSTRW